MDALEWARGNTFLAKPPFVLSLCPFSPFFLTERAGFTERDVTTRDISDVPRILVVDTPDTLGCQEKSRGCAYDFANLNHVWLNFLKYA